MVCTSKSAMICTFFLWHIDLGGLDMQDLVTCYRPAAYAFAIWGVIYMMDA